MDGMNHPASLTPPSRGGAVFEQNRSTPSVSTQTPVNLPRVSLRTAILYSVANIGLSLVTALFSTALPKYLDTYHLRPELIGLLSAEQPARGSLIGPFVGRLSDRLHTRVGRRRLFFLIGPPLTALTLVILGLHPPTSLMIALVAFSGLCAVANDPYLALMADMTPHEQRGQVGALLGLADLVGGIIFLVVAGVLWTAHQFAVFLLVAGGLLVAFAITFFAVQEPAQRLRTQRLPLNPLPYLRDVLRYHELPKYLAIATLSGMAKGGASPFLILLLTKTLRVPVGAAFFLALSVTVTSAIFVLPVGVLGDRIGKKPLLLAGALVASLGLGGLAFLARAGVSGRGWILACLIVIGLAGSTGAALALPMLTELVPARRVGELIGLYSFIFSVAFVAGAVGAGHLITSTQLVTYGNPYIWSAVLYICAALVLMALDPAQARAAVAAEDAAMAG